MIKYQSVLPAVTRKDCIDRRSLARRMKSKIAAILSSGFYWCNSCEARCEREEGENGQPAHCARCGSARIEYMRPIIVEESRVLQPEDLEAA